MLERVVAALVGWSARRALIVVLLLAALTVWAGLHVVHTLKMNSDTSAMISDKLAWRQQWDELGKLFPQNNGLLVVVVDGATPDQAEDATEALYEKLALRKDLFTSVRRPDGGPFFQRYGLLFLPVDSLQRLSNSVAMAQPFIGSLRADPSLRGLFDMLALAADGVAQQTGGLAMLQRPLGAIEASLTSALEGKPKPLSWQTLLMDRPVEPRDLRHLILTQPVRDFSSLATAASASRFIREEAQALGLTPDKGITVRLTGSVALQDEELQTVTEGMGTALVLSIVLVLGLLLVALRSAKLILASFITLLVGLVLTFAFASFTVNPLNPISVAFAVMFIGLSIDFGIQFGVRFGQERYLDADPATVLPRTGYAMARPLTLAAVAIAVGFASFLPTDYRGVSELGLIATAGMIVTLVLNLTLMPALLALLKPRGTPREMGYLWAAPVDEFLLRRRRWVLLFFGLVTLLGVGAAYWLRFDYNPLHLRDPKVESMATILDLMRDPLSSPFTIETLAPDIEAAQETAGKLSALPEVAAALTAASFIPQDQDAKLAIISDLQLLIGPTLDQSAMRPPPSDDEIRASMKNCAQKLRQALPDLPAAQALAAALDRAAAADGSLYPLLTELLIKGLDARLKLLSVALTAEPLDLDKLPEELRRDWIAPDGRARVQAFPSGNANDNDIITKLVQAVRTVVPDATGSAVQIYESGRAVANAFRIATITALVAITLLLGLLLRRLRDVLLVLAPILVAGFATMLVCVLIGLEVNFANIIALPLLLGIGVAFTIYFVVNWRKGVTHPLTSSTSRAVLFSALATGASFGSLALSSHPGTAGMGLLLLLSLVIMLTTIFLFLPALMGPPPSRG
ncbi:MAG TPA: MMPL family transporter [Hypericibacter adhaerens]|jgi:hopanoid biosynthesis associated RND transporter like protein HpnN|nr:MMPL family transporter [Hypericibacter adhaerens]HWA44946.1 MMPL family transporter [Hypericibacter adhaerens]